MALLLPMRFMAAGPPRASSSLLCWARFFAAPRNSCCATWLRRARGRFCASVRLRRGVREALPRPGGLGGAGPRHVRAGLREGGEDLRRFRSLEWASPGADSTARDVFRPADCDVFEATARRDWLHVAVCCRREAAGRGGVGSWVFNRSCFPIDACPDRSRSRQKNNKMCRMF